MATAIRLEKRSMRKFLVVSEKEVVDFVSNKDNEGKLKAAYDSQKEKYSVPEQVKASHLLVRSEEGKEEEAKKKIEKIAKEVNVKNFKTLAAKYTEDPSGKAKGGSLGTFSKGKMTPEFDQAVFSQKVNTVSAPVKTEYGYHLIYVEEKKAAQNTTYDQAKKELAKQLIQNSRKDEELKPLVDKVAAELMAALKTGKKFDLEKAKYGFEFEENKEFNRLAGKVGALQMNEEAISKAFPSGKTVSDTFLFDKGTELVLLKTFASNKADSQDAKSIESEENNQKTKISREIRESIMKNLQETSKVVTYTEMM